MTDLAKRIAELPPEKRELLLQRLSQVQVKKPEPELIPVQNRETNSFDLSFAQERLWFLDQLEPGSHIYNIPVVLRLTGPLDQTSFERGVNEVVARHEALRLNFTTVGGTPVQVITPPQHLPLPLIDLSDLPPDMRASKAEQLMEEEAQCPFNLAEDLLIRTTLLRLGIEEHLFLLTLHHIVSDAWSVGIFMRELAAFYRAFVTKQPVLLPTLPVQYIDFAYWQRQWFQSNKQSEQLAYWKQQLASSLPPLAIPLDYPRPPRQTYRGGRTTRNLPLELARALRTLSQREEATLFMTLLAAFKLLLYRYTGQDDLCVGSPIAGRNRVEIENLIGYFLNILVLRTQFSNDISFHDLLRQIREAALGAYAHQDIPFEHLLAELRPDRDMSRTPLFQVFFNLITVDNNQIDLPDLNVEFVLSPEIGSKFDMTLYVGSHPEEITLTLVYNADLFSEARMTEMLAQYEYLLTQIVANPNQKLSNFSLVTDSAKALLPDPTQSLNSAWLGAVQTRFSDQARQHPNRVALVDKAGSWTYQELEVRSNQLAHYLLEGGMQSQEVVAIFADRSAALVWAVLGILKAGATFVIFDPAYPNQRLLDYLCLAQPRAWLSLKAAGMVPAALTEFLTVLGCSNCLELPPLGSEADHLLKDYSTANPGLPIGPDDRAYLAFTSGSTGQPKGIVGTHSPLSHFFQWHCQTFGLNETDRFSMLGGLGHDPLLRDIFTPLWLGATLCIPGKEEMVSPAQLASWLKQQNITITHLTPPLAQFLTETTSTNGYLPALRYAFFGGDILTRNHVIRLRQFAPGITCVNFYGATETPQAMAYTIVSNGDNSQTSDSTGRIPLGKGIQDVQLLILSSAKQLAGVSELGEIYIRTPYLTQGYLQDETLTQERFITNPYTGITSDRLYKSGDLGRYLPDGTVEFVGRSDHQVKIRGFRIELTEIEDLLKQYPAVQNALVLDREDVLGDKRLVAYLVSNQQVEFASQELRRYLKDKLPEYMIPSSFVKLQSLPLTPNGKLDIQALPSPNQVNVNLIEDFVAPASTLERSIAEVWQEVLGVDRVGVYDNFFDLGGHSLLMVRAMAQLEQRTGVKLALGYVAYQTLGQLAATYEAQLSSDISKSNGQKADEFHQVLIDAPDINPKSLGSISFNPFYFCSSGKSLFGCYHPPLGGRIQTCAVVLCYPFGHEYTRSHRAFQQLAVRLARVGFPVLRFDFFGCGDSEGETEEGNFNQWLGDISQAIAEVQKRSGLRQVYLVGLRLGAALAMLAGMERSDIAGLVLWQPIINGKAYLKELTGEHQKAIWRFPVAPKNHHFTETPLELLGFPLTETLLTDFEQLDLLALNRKPAQNLLIIEGQEERTAEPLSQHLQRQSISVTYHHIPSFTIWLEDVDKGLVPNQTLQAIIAWISEVFV